MKIHFRSWLLPLQIALALTAVSAQADATYEYSDSIELHACIPNSWDADERRMVPFAGELCPGLVVPFSAGRSIRTGLGGDACTLKDENGASVLGTKFACPAREQQLSDAGDDRVKSLIASFARRGDLASRSGGLSGRGSRTGFTRQEAAQYITGLVGPRPVATADRQLLDAFVRILLEQHPQLLLPKKYEGGVGLTMPAIRFSMTKAVAFYKNWYRINKDLQKDPAEKIAELPLKRAIAANFDPDPKYQNQLKRKSSIVIIDLTKPRDEPRFYVINTVTKETNEAHVKHGKGSGKGNVTQCVSNRCDSNMSPYGFHVTGEQSYSKKMKRQKIVLIGLESINSNSEKRGILIHPTKNIDEETGVVKGCTLGCAGINPEVFEAIDGEIRGGNLVLFYHSELEETYAKALKKEVYKPYLAQLR